tara:strand:- start:514 stop:846 length:333 start_codon:yes stop_codon:yes gene_type:complete
MKRRKFISAGIALLSSLLIINNHQSTNDFKYNVLKKILIKFKNNHNFNFTSNSEKSFFVEELLKENFNNSRELKNILRYKILDDYKSNKLVFNKTRYISETEYYLYSLKT